MRRGKRPGGWARPHLACNRVVARVVVGLVLPLTTACATNEETAVGADCRALLELGERASACAPDLAALVARIRAAPAEQACSRAARTLLEGPQDPLTRPRSLFEATELSQAAPLTAAERADLGRFALPATVEIELDVPLEPGVASTRAELGAMALTTGPDGALRAEVRPGAYPLRLHHAGQSSVYCIQLASCETTRVVAHGARLARQHGVAPGPC